MFAPVLTVGGTIPSYGLSKYIAKFPSVFHNDVEWFENLAESRYYLLDLIVGRVIVPTLRIPNIMAQITDQVSSRVP